MLTYSPGAVDTFACVVKQHYPDVSRLTVREAESLYLCVVESIPTKGSPTYQSFYRACHRLGVTSLEFRETMIREYWREVGRREARNASNARPP